LTDNGLRGAHGQVVTSRVSQATKQDHAPAPILRPNMAAQTVLEMTGTLTLALSKVVLVSISCSFESSYAYYLVFIKNNIIIYVVCLDIMCDFRTVCFDLS